MNKQELKSLLENIYVLLLNEKNENTSPLFPVVSGEEGAPLPQPDELRLSNEKQNSNNRNPPTSAVTGPPPTETEIQMLRALMRLLQRREEILRNGTAADLRSINEIIAAYINRLIGTPGTHGLPWADNDALAEELHRWLFERDLALRDRWLRDFRRNNPPQQQHP